MSIGLWIAVAAVVLAVAFGGYRAATDGRFARRVRDEDGPRTAGATGTHPHDAVWSSVSAAVPEALPGERATLVQFSSAFCAPCRATRRVLDDIAARVPGVTHVEIDAEAHLDLVRRLGILRTPTTIVLDAAGAEVARASGAPRPDQVLNALPSA